MDYEEFRKWKDEEADRYIIACMTCNTVFLSPNYEPPIFWYVLAAQHWLENPKHEIALCEVINGKKRLYLWSVLWRRAGSLNVLKEVEQIKTKEEAL